MNRTHVKKIMQLILGIFIVWGSSSCIYFVNHQTIPHDEYYMSFSPNVLSDIKNNRQEVLKHANIPSYDELEDLPQKERSMLRETDYWTIVDYIFTRVMDDSFSDWELEYVYFLSDCENLETFHTGRFQFVKDIKTEDKEYESWFTRNIFIQTRNNSVLIWDKEEYPKRFGRRSVGLEQAKTSANEALEIAEQNGGFESRRSVDNQCNISIHLLLVEDDFIPIIRLPIEERFKWTVSYYDFTKTKSIFRYWVELK